MTRYDIIHNFQYRDNPGSRYHTTYQAMINRLFYVFMFIMTEVVVWAHFGFTGVAVSIPMIFIAGVCLAIALMAIGGFIDILGDFVEWVMGN